MDIDIKSSAFEHGGVIPSKYTCDGANVSPPLQWGLLPPGTVTLAIISDDPDAPVGTWVHWVIYNIPSEDLWIPENIPCIELHPDGCLQGMNDFKRIGYGGPCPPGGTHRYFFKLYALDKRLNLPAGITKSQLVTEMEGHILGSGELMGLYTRQR